jgi:hypothetical protein
MGFLGFFGTVASQWEKHVREPKVSIGEAQIAN